MPDRAQRVSVEQVDWPTALPLVHLFQSFRMAIQPGKLVLGLVLTIAVLLGGRALDGLWGSAVSAGEFAEYIETAWPSLSEWSGKVGEASPSEAAPIFATTLRLQTTAFSNLISAATGLGVNESTDALPGSPWSEAGWSAVIMLAVVPAWLATHHPLFLVVFAIFKLLLVAILGGAIARLAAVEACRDERASALEGLRFAGYRYPWFLVAPLIPLAVVAIIGLLLALAGGALFNLPGVDVLGAIVLPLMMLGGFVIALVLLGLAVGLHLLYPGIAVEGTDAFDAISRAFNYILGRPWRYVGYSLVMLIHGLLTFLFFATIVYLTLAATHWATGLWALDTLGSGANRFDAIVPAPQLDALLRPAAWWAGEGTGTAGVAAWIASLWIKLLVALMPAFLISYYFAAHTWIYLLLRRAADGTEFDDIYRPSEQPGETA